MHSKVTKLVVPLRWSSIINTAPMLVLFSFILFKSASIVPLVAYTSFAYTCILILMSAFLRFGVHYALCSNHLEARLFGIPFWRIPWKQITNATYLHAWKDVTLKHSSAMGGMAITAGNTYGQIIYVTLKGCPKYHPKHEIRLFHNLLHPFRTACIWLPRETKYQYIDAFKEYYPGLEIQPLDV